MRPAPALIVIILAAFFMVYFARINYALAVFAVTIGVTQFYTQMGELSSALLTTRVEETALGAACAILVGLAVLPLRTVHAATLALAGYLRALAQVLDGLTVPGHPATGTTPGPAPGSSTLVSTPRPLRCARSPERSSARPNPRCTRVLQLVDLSHELGRTSRTTAPRRALEPTSRSSPESPAALHRWPEPSHRAWTGPRQPCRPFLPGQHRTAAPRQPTPATGSLRSEVEDIEAVARDPPIGAASW